MKEASHRTLFPCIILLGLAVHIIFFLHTNASYLKGYFSCLGLSREKQIAILYKEEYYKRVSFIKDTTPEDSFILLPTFKESASSEISYSGLTSYFIFPRRCQYVNYKELPSYNGPVYKVDMTGSEFIQTGILKKYVLDEKFALLLLKQRRGVEAQKLADFSAIKTRVPNAIFALIKLLLICLSGAYIAAAYLDKHRLPDFITTSFLAGTVIVTILYIFFSLTGINFTEPLQFITLGLISVPGVILLVKHKILIKDFPVFSNKVTFAIVGFYFALLFMKSLCTPILSWDACVNWGAKAKAIFALHNLAGLSFWGAHRGYPPLFSVLMSQVAIGGEKTIKFIFPLFALCLYVIIYEEIYETSFSSRLKMLLPLLILFTAPFIRNSLNGYADLALTVFVTKSVSVLAKIPKTNGSKQWLSLAAMLSGVVLVRPEGWVYFLYIGLLAFVWSCFFLKKFKNIVYLFLPAASYLLWLIYYKFFLKGLLRICLTGGLIREPFIKNWPYLKTLTIYFVRYTVNPRFWGAIPAFFVGLCLFRWSRFFRKFSLEIIFILMATAGLFFTSYYAGSAWSIEVLFNSFARHSMVFVPTMFIITLKEIDSLMNNTIGVSQK